jgi:hypothetical protein
MHARIVSLSLVAGLAATLALPTRAVALDVYALGVGASSNTIVRFDSATPGTVSGPSAVAGLTAGDTLVGIDFRPATDELVGLAVNGNTARLYRIDPADLTASSIGAATVNAIAGATAFGVDFNPTVDRLRVVNNLASDGAGGNANNFRLNPNDGSLVNVDADIDVTGLPGGNANAPEIAVAYSNSVANAASTTLFGLVSGGDRLVTNGGAAPDFSTLQNVDLLGQDTSNNAGFDIAGSPEQAFAILEGGGVSRFFTIDLATGAATLVGTIGTGSIDFGGMSIRRATVRQLAAAICGRTPAAAAAVSTSALVTPVFGGDTPCLTLCQKWTAVCRKIAGTLKTCWQNAGKQTAAAGKLRCIDLAGDDKKECVAAIKVEQTDLKLFLATDLESAVAFCLGAGVAQCLANCS